ncbi:MAG: lipoyl(octanoyl) transferase LipB [Deltaproteobacteria bacterium]|nr:lipoyl(octanoyl) transferase LipB [Deltaproteobacteria bacterium]
MSLVAGRVLDLGLLGYERAWQVQLDLVAQRQQGDGLDTLILVEHPHVITLGRKQKALANVLGPGDVPVIEVERGGDVTYHGPGQVVAYPIVALREGERDLHRFLRNLEEALIRTVAALGIGGAGRRDGATGAWVGDKKIASIGIACRRWVTFHGVALNVSTDLAYFHRINPCGFPSSVMTSLQEILGQSVPLSVVKPLLVRHMGDVLGREFAKDT